MRNLLTAIAVFFLVFSIKSVISPTQAHAQSCDASTLGQCITGKKCIQRYDPISGTTIYDLGEACGGSAVVGGIRPPKGVLNNNASSGDIGGIGIIYFFSILIRLATIIAGIWVMFNVIFAGFTYISSNGDAGAHAKVNEKLTYSVIGILVIVIAYTIAALLSLLLFGDATFILNPTLTTISTVGTTGP